MHVYNYHSTLDSTVGDSAGTQDEADDPFDQPLKDSPNSLIEHAASFSTNCTRPTNGCCGSNLDPEDERDLIKY